MLSENVNCLQSDKQIASSNSYCDTDKSMMIEIVIDFFFVAKS